ncbi:MAG: flagellar protein FlgN [Christensenellaceae bacterium]|nr:flagellar protein FlgN [Christensenellaceae bacterium]
MEDLLNGLIDVVQQELTVYQSVLGKANQKKEALIKNDISMLEHIVARESGIVKTMQELEQRREGLIRAIAEKHGLDEQKATLADIAALYPDKSETLLTLKTELSRVLAEIQKLNEANKALLDTHLQYTSFCINLLTGGSSPFGTYSNSGQISEQQESKTLVLDQMV